MQLPMVDQWAAPTVILDPEAAPLALGVCVKDEADGSALGVDRLVTSAVTDPYAVSRL